MDIELDLSDFVEGGCDLPNVHTYQYYKCLDNNTIILNRDIDDTIMEYAILPYEQLDADPNVTHITVLINSGGGTIRPAFSFISSLERGHTPTTLRIIGDADSMATYIMMAQGDHIHKVCDKWCVGLLHAGEQGTSGEAGTVNDTLKFNQYYEKKIEEFVLSHSNIDKKLYNKIRRVQYWMDAQQMLELGIVDEII